MELDGSETVEMCDLDTCKISKSEEDSANNKPRVTFQLGSEDKDDENSTYDEKSDMDPPEMSGKDRFKRRVSKIMEENAKNKLKKDSNGDEDDEIGKDLATVTKYLLKKSSIYAVSQVGHADSVYRKVLWVIVLLAGLLGCGYEIYRFLTLYLQYPVVVNLHVENKRSLEFPAVTICNLNRMQKKYEICLDRNTSDIICPIPRETDTGGIAISERMNMASCFGGFTGYMDSNMNDRLEFLTKYSQLDASSRKVFGHQYNDVIQSCSYNGEPCPLEYFSFFQSLKYGNCYTFNRFSIEDDTVLKTSVVGIMSGLDLTLNFDPDNYLPVTTSVGARVIIHDPRDDPNPEEDGMNISPGFETTLSMKLKSISRLPAPYKDNCVNYGKDATVRGNNRNECVKSCMQEENYARCACIDPSLPFFKDYRRCNMSDSNETCCLNSALNNMAVNGLPCNCPLPCFSTNYEVRLSTAIWPSVPSYFDDFCAECTDDKQNLEILRQKAARLKIYYSTLEHAIYEQKATFQDSELFSHLGGQLGLWLGLSIVAAFELVENVIYICKYCAKSPCCSKSK